MQFQNKHFESSTQVCEGLICPRGRTTSKNSFAFSVKAPTVYFTSLFCYQQLLVFS